MSNADSHRFLNMRSVSYRDEDSALVYLGGDVLDLLGHPDDVAFLVNEESGVVTLVPSSEVGLR